MVMSMVFGAFEELTDKDPVVILKALAFLLEDGGEWKDTGIPIFETFLEKARQRRNDPRKTQLHPNTQ